MNGVGWGLRSLRRQPLRTGLSLAGIAVAAAMLLDMVMLSGGIDRSFADLLSIRGYQIRITPKGTLPFDAEATISGAAALMRELRADPDIETAGAVLGTSLYARARDSLVSLVGYGIEPRAQGMYQVTGGNDLAPGDTSGILLGEPTTRRLHARVGDTVEIVGRLDPQMSRAASRRRLIVRGEVQWLYDPRGQISVGTVLPLMQRLAGATADDRVSVIVVKVRGTRTVASVAERLRGRFPALEVNSVEELVAQFHQRMVYFRQLSYILGSMSLLVTVLLIATLLTITVNERLGEVATLRALGISRATIVHQVLTEGTALTLVGAGLGIVLGLATARRLDAILTSFPGLPAAFSFFVPRADSIGTAFATLLVTGILAGGYPAWLAARAPIAATLRAEAT